MLLNEIKNAITALKRPNGSFFGFETETKPKLTAKNRTTKKPTDFEVVIRSQFSALLGVNYERAVNNHIAREGGEPTFVAQKPKGKHYIAGSHCLMTDDKTGTKFYIAVDKVGGMKRTYFINGREASDAEIADLKANYLPKVSEPVHGVTWRTYGIESVKAIH